MKIDRRFHFSFVRAVPLSNWRLRLTAAVVTGGLFLLFFSAVSYRDFRREQNPVNRPGVTLLNSGAWSPEQRAAFRRWVRIQDPAALTGVDAPGGFLSQLPASKRFHRTTLRRETLPAAPEPPPLAVALLERRETPMLFGTAPLFSIGAQKPTATRIRIIDENGRGISVPPELFSGAVPSASGMTMLYFFRRNGIPAGRVVISCGDPKLDRAAESALAPLRRRDDGMVCVFWPAPGGKK